MTPLDIVVRKLEKHMLLTAGEKKALREAFETTTDFAEGDDLGSIGESVSFVGALLVGHLCRQLTLNNGSRQLLSLPMAGDTVQMQSGLLNTMDHSVTALTPCTLAIASKAAIEAMSEEFPRLADILCRNVAIEASVTRQWVLSMGRRDAYGRLSHLFCEMFSRMSDAGLTTGASYAMPLTQAELSDATGMSVVHVNRTLMQLRDRGLIRLGRGRLTVCDWDGLVSAGAFDPAYLHLHEIYSAPNPPQERSFS
ncbi:Crp/Fnr family transcriptional regulator [soil metagenome]